MCNMGLVLYIVRVDCGWQPLGMVSLIKSDNCVFFLTSIWHHHWVSPTLIEIICRKLNTKLFQHTIGIQTPGQFEGCFFPNENHGGSMHYENPWGYPPTKAQICSVLRCFPLRSCFFVGAFLIAGCHEMFHLTSGKVHRSTAAAVDVAVCP